MGALLLVWAALSISSPAQHSGVAEKKTPLRVQLPWTHQSQFAGVYVAALRGYFDDAGLEVEVLEGHPGIETSNLLTTRKADLVIDWLLNVRRFSDPHQSPVVNVGQIFSESALVFLCHRGRGIHTLPDIAGRIIGTWGIGETEVLHAILRREGIPTEGLRIVPQPTTHRDFLNADIDCIVATRYNEMWHLLQSGKAVGDLLALRPQDFDVPHFEDGIYVAADRLDDPGFTDALERFIQALGHGWQDAASSRELALEATRVFSGFGPERAAHERFMLDEVLTLLPPDPLFGRLDLNQVAKARQAYLGHIPEAPPFWTHQVWNDIEEKRHGRVILEDATRHYADVVFAGALFSGFLFFGIMNAALSGVLAAVDEGFDLWGRLMLAGLSAVGGGTLRDVILGRGAPMFYIDDPVIPLGILALVLAISATDAVFGDLYKTASVQRIKHISDTIGFVVLTIAGAQLAISIDIALIWVPLMGALTCAGGGMLRDIACGRVPASFSGQLYEEISLLGAAVYLIGLILLQDEHSSLSVYVSGATAVVIMVVLRSLAISGKLSSPIWLLRGRSLGEQPENSVPSRTRG